MHPGYKFETAPSKDMSKMSSNLSENGQIRW